jgi:hypothetical protein
MMVVITRGRVLSATRGDAAKAKLDNERKAEIW